MLSCLDNNLLAIYSDASSVPQGNGIGVALTVRDYSEEGKEIHIETTNTGNQAAIHRIKNSSDNPGQAWQLRCFYAATETASKQASISLHRAPGHEGIDGNERADSLAKDAALARLSSKSTSLAMTGIRINNVTELEWRLALSRYYKFAMEQNPKTYAKLFKWKIRKRLFIPSGTVRNDES